MSNKARMINEPYTGNALKFKQELENSVTGGVVVGRIYTHEKGFKWLENSHGYIHIWVKKTTRATGDDEQRIFYLIDHYRLTRDNGLQEASYTPYATQEAMERDFAELGEED